MYRYLKLMLTAAIALPIGLTAGTVAEAQAASLWNESIDGDLSDIGAMPTQLSPLLLGSNTLSATFNAGSANPSPDYFTIDIPDGLALSEIVLKDWQSSPTFEDIAFFAVQAGSVFDFQVPADRSNANGLLGWTHLRSTQVDSNKVLTEIATANLPPAESGAAANYAAEAETYPAELVAQFPDLPDKLRALEDQWVPGATGFSTPLSAGKYTFWLRQGSDTDITAMLDFTAIAATDVVKTPEPFSLLALGAISSAGLLLKRRRPAA